MNYRADDIRSCNGALNSEKNIFLKSELQPIKSYYLYLAKYFQSEKYYAIGSLCGALLYNENGKEKFVFYDANFSNVAGLDIFGQQLYSNEYGPNGEILHSIEYSNVSFRCNLYDEDLGSYIDEMSGAKSPFPKAFYVVYLTPLIKELKGFRGNNHTTEKSVDWTWVIMVCGNPKYQNPEAFWDCVMDTIYLNDDELSPDSGGGVKPKVPCWDQKTKGDCYNCCSYWLSEGITECHWVTAITLFILDRLCINYAWRKYEKCTDRCEEEFTP